jgi:glucose dehydrogenase
MAWVFPTQEPVSSSPAVANGRVYVGSGKYVYCIDATSGASIWNSTAVSNQVWRIFRSSPAVKDNKLFIGYDGYGTIYCLDATTGSMIWEHTTGYEILSSPAVADGKVFVSSSNGFIYCLDETNGNEIWSKHTLDRIVSSPAVTQGVVYVGCGGELSGSVYAFGTKIDTKSA